MGTFFSNCQVQSGSQEAVTAALTRLLTEPAYTSPSVGGWIGVYPEGTRTDLDKLAKQLSKQLSCGVFSWNVHDDDIFYYTLFDEGKRRDEFNSIPDYFDPVSKSEKNRLRGKPEALMSYCLIGISASQVQAVLHPLPHAGSELVEQQTVKYYQSASGQAGALAELLGMDWQLSSLSYRYIERGEAPLDSGEIVLISAEMLSAKNRRPQLWELPMVAEEIKAALDQGANPNEISKYGQLFFLVAAFKNAAEVVQVLLDAGGNANTATTKKLEYEYNERGVTALMAAVMGGANSEMGPDAAHSEPQIKTVQILLDAGANVNARSESGMTALSEARKNVKRFADYKAGRWYSEDVLAECVARNTTLVEMLRAAGATE